MQVKVLFSDKENKIILHVEDVEVYNFDKKKVLQKISDILDKHSNIFNK